MKRKYLFYLAISMLLMFSTTYSAKYNSSLILQGEEYLAFAPSMPAPVGGLPAIYKKISYPEIAKQAGVEGKVYLIAFINKNGNVDDVKIIKKLGAGCDEAAIKAIKSSEFTPGMFEGKPANVKLSLQIQFKLNK